MPEESPYAARAALLSADGTRLSAREFARELLAMTQEEFSAAFKGSPMKRAKLRGLKRNAAVVLGNVGTAEDVELLARVCGEELDGLVRELVAWALGAIASPEAIFTLRAQSSVESEVRVLDAIRLALARADA